MRPPLSIIAADTDKDTRFLIRVYLRGYRVNVIEASGSPEFAEIIKKENPSAAVVNFVLDDTTGYRLAEEFSKNLPFIIMIPEGFDLFEDRPGISEYLVKPFGRREFLEALDKALGPGTLKYYLKGEPEDEKPPESRTPAVEALCGYEKLKVLAADDEKPVLHLLRAMLGDKVNCFDTASTGEELVEKALSGEYDLIISDVIMPRLSGWKAVAEIRGKGISTPVIFSSGLIKDKELYETLRPEGRSRFLLKPFKKEELFAALREILEF